MVKKSAIPASPSSASQTDEQLVTEPDNINSNLSRSAQPVDQNWPDKVFWAAIFIGAGLVLMAINLGYLPWPDWSRLVGWWPAALIIAGLHIFLNKAPLSRWVVSIVSLALIIVGVGYAMIVADYQLYQSACAYMPWLPAISQNGDQQLDKTDLKSQHVVENQPDYAQAATRVINLDMDLGSIDIQPVDMDRQIELYSQNKTSTPPTSSQVKVDNNQVTVDLDIGHSPFSFINPGPQPRYLLNIGQINQPSEVNLDLGAGKATMDLTQSFSLRGGTWQVGAGELTAKLGSTSLPAGLLKLDVGVGKMVIYIPSGIGVSIKHDVGIGDLEVFNQHLEKQGTYTSDNYDQATIKVSMEAEVGVGKLIISQLENL